MRPLYVKETEKRFYHYERATSRVETDDERPSERRRPLALSALIEVCREALAKQVCERDFKLTLGPADFSN